MWTLLILPLLIALLVLFLFVHGILIIKKLPTDELVDNENTIPWDYFDYIGRDLPEVIEYVTLVKAKDFVTIHKHWLRFHKAFLNAETKAGWKGRPLIMDYYLNYRRCLREYLRRTT
jgi:hypothetical protein